MPAVHVNVPQDMGTFFAYRQDMDEQAIMSTLHILFFSIAVVIVMIWYASTLPCLSTSEDSSARDIYEAPVRSTSLEPLNKTLRERPQSLPRDIRDLDAQRF